MGRDQHAVGIDRIELGQRRFRNGALYVSAPVDGAEVGAIECRFLSWKNRS